MKYKLKYWTFGDYECEEMEAYLNNMAAKGYKLKSITEESVISIITGWATFEKTEKAKQYRYCADVIEEKEKDDYLQLCKDAGWTETAWSGDNVCVLSTTAPDAKPLYADRNSRLEKMIEYNKEKYGSINPYLYITLILLGFAAAIGFIIWYISGGWTSGLSWYGFVFLAWLMSPFKRASSLVIIGFVERGYAENTRIHFRALSRFSEAAFPIFWILSVLAMNVFVTETSSLTWIIVLFPFVGIFCVGSALSGYYNRPDFSAWSMVIGLIWALAMIWLI